MKDLNLRKSELITSILLGNIASSESMNEITVPRAKVDAFWREMLWYCNLTIQCRWSTEAL
jgi:hypothetical protein